MPPLPPIVGRPQRWDAAFDATRHTHVEPCVDARLLPNLMRSLERRRVRVGLDDRLRYFCDHSFAFRIIFPTKQRDKFLPKQSLYH